jgi:hypothetical protein
MANQDGIGPLTPGHHDDAGSHDRSTLAIRKVEPTEKRRLRSGDMPSPSFRPTDLRPISTRFQVFMG